MNRLPCIFFVVTLIFTVRSVADVVDFEDVEPFNIPATPFSSGGLDFVSTQIENAIIPSGFAASDNGTQTFGWCGSACGGTQLITATADEGELFNVLSIDAGNLFPSDSPNGYVTGMTVEVVGNLPGGGSITQSLLIVENQFTSFLLEGFTGLTSLEIFAPEVLAEGGVKGNPDPVVDNIVFNTVPEPGATGLVLLAAAGLITRRRRSSSWVKTL